MGNTFIKFFVDISRLEREHRPTFFPTVASNKNQFCLNETSHSFEWLV